MNIRSTKRRASARLAFHVVWLACAACQTGLTLDTAPDGSVSNGGQSGAAPQAGVGPVYSNDASVPTGGTGRAGTSGSDDGGTRDASRTGCGDGELQSGEACDDGNDVDGDGCSADCKTVAKDYLCPAPGEMCVSTVACGDGRLGGQETCDDGNTNDGDGCDAHCVRTPGYVCATAGQPCGAAACGDGILAADETCDDGNTTAQDGCSDACRLEPGYTCDAPKTACRLTVCGDGKREGSEPCDDGNQSVGDGCNPFCEVEPDCSAGACHSQCGDGLILPSDAEECDDGNVSDHDGCSHDCKVESGYECERETGELPDVLQVPVTYRDFIALPATGATRHPDFEKFSGAGITPGLVDSTLGSDGKPVFTGACDDTKTYSVNKDNPKLSVPATCPYGQQMTKQDAFNQWYRDVAGVNVSKVERMTLTLDKTTGKYTIDNSAFFPWDGDSRSWVGQGKEVTATANSLKHNFGFTSEIRTYFEFKLDAANPPTLTFNGDDDVWVFINHHLAVDVGGLHSKQTKSVTLDQAGAAQFGLESGKIYEIVLFHAERHTTASNFKLDLKGFVSTRSHCAAECGDGIMAGKEQCDRGAAANDGSYGACTADCQRGPYCGDNKLQAPQESCDDGVNLTTYSATGEAACAPGCKPSAFCGDGRVDSAAGEQCDDGKTKNTGAYNLCGSDCRRGPRCGDGVVQSEQGEQCDDGNLIGNDGCSGTCIYESPI